LAASKRQAKDRGIHVLSVETNEMTCIYNITNGSTALALDLGRKHL